MDIQRSAPFFDRLWDVATSPGHLLEGGVWGFFCGVDVTNLSQAIGWKRSLLHSPDSDPEKGDRIWEANKQIISSYSSFVSNSSATVSWLDKVYLISVGPLAPLLATIGYGGRSIVSLVRASQVLQEIKDGAALIREESDPEKVRGQSHMQRKRVVNLAFQIALIAWAVLSVLESVTEDVILYGAHTWFTAAFVLFCIELTLTLFGPGQKKEDHVPEGI